MVLGFHHIMPEASKFSCYADATANTNEIYSEMVEPSILLDQLEEELEYADGKNWKFSENITEIECEREFLKNFEC